MKKLNLIIFCIVLLFSTMIKGHFWNKNDKIQTNESSSVSATVSEQSEGEKQKTIKFAGKIWFVKKGKHTGTGYNNWSNSSKSVWVDEHGRLHLKIRKRGNSWYSAEIFSKEYMKKNEYTFQISSDLEKYDPNIVIGLFLYENDSEEIDIEFSKWGESSSKKVGQFVIQPHKTEGNIFKFHLGLSSEYSTHKLIWEDKRVTFRSYHGHYPKVPSNNFLISEWIYRGENIPSDNGKKKLHINFWLKDGLPPFDRKEAELIISNIIIGGNK